jgi:hypothetical protein
MIGPAVAGLLITKVGVGWAFLLNGLSFAAVLLSTEPSMRGRVMALRVGVALGE